ncbi:RHS repeat protein [Amycolatopsis sp. 195334CR]|uniref:RHS repeat protein n=1 Tax=Amycolatopsis sp. 195334CR TaxID=2814588 RepID=UPI001A8F9B4E|nr:RHS repeat protein [Amycolatopsis sp. 195334CR]MBN6038464.1 RHS repeat protein [Amycolatopsis sp. 195334CR]
MVGWCGPGTNLEITNQLKAITALSGRRVEFVYSDRGLLQEMTDGAGTSAKKIMPTTLARV